MVDVRHKKGVTTYEFAVTNGDRAWDALTNISSLLSIGIMPQRPLPADYPLRRNLAVFNLTGFIWNSQGGVRKEIIAGRNGEVGTKYRYTFPINRSASRITISSTIEVVSIEEEANRKMIVLRSVNVPSGKIPAPRHCCCDYYLPMEQTESKFELIKGGASWRVKMSHTGPNPRRRVQYEGFMDVCGCITCFACVCPCAFLLCWPCLICFELTEVNRPALDQIHRLKRYMDTYGNSNQQGNVRVHTQAPGVQSMKYPVAIPVAHETEYEETNIAARIRKFHDLYKSGAITLKEFEDEKARILSRV